MKQLNKILGIIIIFAFINIGCKKDGEVANAIYITPNASLNITTTSITIDSSGGNLIFTSRAAHKVSQDVNINYTISENDLIFYNKSNGTNYIVLPTQYYTLSSNIATITDGNAISSSNTLTIKPIADLPDTNQYVIPITVSGVSNGLPILQSSRTMFVILNKIIYTKALHLNSGQTLDAKYKTPYANIASWTFEWRVQMDALSVNNAALIYSYLSEVYTRFGDVTITTNQLQIKTAGLQFSPANTFTPKIWYNFAITYDGKNLKWYQNGTPIMTQTVSATYNFSTIGFGGTSSKSVNEIRFWNYARSQSQIVNNMYSLNPNTPGLEGYWKCNEGSGTVCKDYSYNKNDMTLSDSKVNWIDIRMPEN